MGKEKTTTEGQTTSQSSTTQGYAPGQENFLNKLQDSAFGGGMFGDTTGGLNALLGNIFSGQNLPGNLGQLSQGLTREDTQFASDQAVGDVANKFQVGNILDSGSFLQAGADTQAGLEMDRQQFNINNLAQLLNMGIQGFGQAQQPMLQQQDMLNRAFSGLQSGTTQGSGTSFQTQLGMNPFLKSFQTSLGSTLGSPKFGFGSGQPSGIGFGG